MLPNPLSTMHPCPPCARRAFVPASATPPKRQRGVVLVISLILIVILSLLGTFAIRNANQSERSVNGIRSAQVAREAAETALRFCEQIAIYDGANLDYTEYGTTGLRTRIVATPVTSEQDSAALWRLADNWKTTSTNVIVVPDQYFKKYNGGTASTDAVQLSTAPRCLIQKLETAGTPKLDGYLITGRGFANNAKFDASTGKTGSGAEAWLQSILTKS